LSLGWEWDNFSNLTNPATSDNDGDWSDDYHEYIAGTEPTNAASFFHISAAARGVGTTNRLITIPTALNRHYRIYFADGISNAMPWFAFGNTNNRVGTWTETNWPPPTTYTFVDDETTNTTFVAPASGRRYYKVRVEKP
jgi:hypothetical protein